MDEREPGAAPYGAGLREVVFAIAEIVGAAAHAADPPRKQSVGRAADVVFAGTELEGATTYRVDVGLEQVVFDGIAGAVIFGAILEPVFSTTELARAAA